MSKPSMPVLDPGSEDSRRAFYEWLSGVLGDNPEYEDITDLGDEDE